MQTLSYKLYQSKKTKHLDELLNIAAEIHNYCIALHKRYYAITGKFIHKYKLIKHIVKAKKRSKYSPWNELNSKCIEDIVFRIDDAYQRFFKKLAKRPPSFKKRVNYQSITDRQIGKGIIGNKVRINGEWYKFSKSREINGNVKTLTVKRNKLGEYFIHIIVDNYINPNQKSKPMTGKSAGFDFGLTNFLTTSDKDIIQAPQFFKESQSKIQKLHKELSSKKDKSNNRKRAKKNLARAYDKTANQRDAFQWKLANSLLDTYDTLCFEDLNIDGMKRLYGKKVSDYAFYSFIQKLEWLSKKHGKEVIKIDRYYASSKTCSICGNKKDKLPLSERLYHCDKCDESFDRDYNASVNILREGLKIKEDRQLSFSGETVRPRRTRSKGQVFTIEQSLH